MTPTMRLVFLVATSALVLLPTPLGIGAQTHDAPPAGQRARAVPRPHRRVRIRGRPHEGTRHGDESSAAMTWSMYTGLGIAYQLERH